MVDNLLKEFNTHLHITKNIKYSRSKLTKGVIVNIKGASDDTKHINYSNSKILCNLIEKMETANYTLTTQDWDKVVNWMCLGKSKSFFASSNNWNNHFGFSQKFASEYYEIIKFIFSRLNPTEKQFLILISCFLKIKKSVFNFYWIDILFEKKFDFNNKQKVLLVEIGYDILKFSINKQFTIEECKEAIINIINGKSNIETLCSILKKNTDLILPSDFLDFVLSVIDGYSINPSRVPKSANDGYSNNQSSSVILVDMFIERCSPTVNTSDILVNKNLQSKTLYYKLIEKGMVPNYNLMKLYTNISHNFDLVVEIMRKMVNVTTEILNMMLKKDKYFFLYKNSTTGIGINPDKELTLKFLDLSKNQLDEISNSSTNYVEIYKLFTKIYKVKPNEETLLLVCGMKNDEYFEDIIQNYNLFPDKNCLLKAIEINNLELCEKLLNFKIFPDQECYLKALRSSATGVIELLFKYGYSLTLNDYKEALKLKIIINGLDRFEINCDEKLYFICNTYNCFTLEFVENYKKNNLTIYNLRLMCKNSNMTINDVIKTMKETGVKIDRYCLDYAVRDNPTLGNYFLNKLNCKPTPHTHLCMSRVIPGSFLFPIIEKINEEYKIDHEFMSKPFEFKLDDLIVLNNN